MPVLLQQNRGIRALAVALIALVGGLVVFAGVKTAGMTALAIPVVMVVALFLAPRPGTVLALTLIPVALFEQSRTAYLLVSPKYFEQLGGQFSPPELQLALVAVGIGLMAGDRATPFRTPKPFTGVLILLAVAIVIADVVGHFGYATISQLSNQTRQHLLLVLLPLFVVNVVRDRRALHAALGLFAVICIVKALVGVVGVTLGEGAPVEDTVLTYYEAVPNFLMVIYLLGVVGALIGRVRLPWWVYAGAPIVTASLVLSYRRSWWIGILVALVPVLVLASGRVGRRLGIPFAIVLLIGGYVAFSNGIVTDLQGSEGAVAKRIESLSPTRVINNREDRYRLDERKNVVAEIREHPITGIGFGTNWTVRYPLGLQFVNGRGYVHFAALWFWLRMGLLGLFVYVALLLLAGRTAMRLWLRSPDPRTRVLGIGMFGGIVAMTIAELTATFTGADLRFTVIYGALLGFLAAAVAIDAEERASPPSSASMRAATTGAS